MINFIQSNHTQDCKLIESNIVTCELWDNLIILLRDKGDNIEDIYSFIEETSSRYNMETKAFIKEFIRYLIYNKDYALSDEWLTLFKYVIHNDRASSQYILCYIVSRLGELYSEL